MSEQSRDQATPDPRLNATVSGSLGKEGFQAGLPTSPAVWGVHATLSDPVLGAPVSLVWSAGGGQARDG